MSKNNKNSGGVQLEKLNWDKECELDLMLGRGFIVSEPAITGKDTKSMYGIQSPLFASDWSDGEDAFTDRFKCACGAMKGKIFEGEICPECKTKIEFRDVNLSYTGLKISPCSFNCWELLYGQSAANYLS